MEQENYEESGKVVSSDAKKDIASSPASIQSQDFVCSFASPTPEKTAHSSRSKNQRTALPVRALKQLSKAYQNANDAIEDETVEPPNSIAEQVQVSDAITEVGKVELPEKYKILAEFFDRIYTSTRLLSLHKKLPTFQNICTVVKVITKRILSYNHLAQMKYVFPEAIQIEIHSQDLCMTPDMKITLLFDVVEVHPNQSPFKALRQVFHERLLDFFKIHSESCDIPEAMLPEPFSQRNHTALPWSMSPNFLLKSHTAPIECEPLLVSSLGQSIRKHFSQKIAVPETEKTELLASAVPPFSHILCSQSSNSSATESPLVKLAQHPHALTVETPAQPTPAKRFFPSSDEKVHTETRVLGHATAKKSLDFSSIEGVSSSVVAESRGYLDNSIQTALAENNLAYDKVNASPSAFPQMVEEYKNHMMNQTGPAKRQQMLASLPDLVSMVQNIFKSANCSFITKQELVQKIITKNLDIVERRFVEEQLELLEELVPDWIFRELAGSGDVLYSIRRVSYMESVLAKISKAV